jgi:aspartate-semialdehyde dehydrogenase
MKPIEVGILGGTGMVGQHFIRFLDGHPWFKLTWIGASERSAGKKLKDATAWRLDGEMSAPSAEITVSDSKPGNAPQLVFSAMDASVATDIEREFARTGHIIVSNSRNHRMEPDVPLLVPEINAGHLALIHSQQKNRGWKGMIVTNPNCSTVVLTMALAPLVQFGIERVMAAYADDSVVRHGVLESHLPFLQKPYTPEILARKVREALDAKPRTNTDWCATVGVDR